MAIVTTESKRVDQFRSQDVGDLVIDCDTHPSVRGGMQSLFPYLPKSWQQRLKGRESLLDNLFPGTRYSHPGSGVLRRDATSPTGGPPGSDPEFMRADHLDHFRIKRALLLPMQAAALSAWTNYAEAIALASAFNRYFLDHWITVDSRYRLGMVVAPHDPIEAVREIHRVGHRDGVAGIYLPMLNMMLGKRYFHPIYKAAAELGLPIVLHGSGPEGYYQGGPEFACGSGFTGFSTYCERYAGAYAEFATSNLINLIFEGVFERFPTLRVVFAEMGWCWVGPAVWAMDRAWRGCRMEVPWVKRPPSDYVRENVRFTSEPVEDPERPEHLLQAAEMMHAEQTLLFATDYPHWDNEHPDQVFNNFPEALRDRIFRQNAIETFGSRLT